MLFIQRHLIWFHFKGAFFKSSFCCFLLKIEVAKADFFKQGNPLGAPLKNSWIIFIHQLGNTEDSKLRFNLFPSEVPLDVLCKSTISRPCNAQGCGSLFCYGDMNSLERHIHGHGSSPEDHKHLLGPSHFLTFFN